MGRLLDGDPAEVFECLFHLAAAKELLGIDGAEDDVALRCGVVVVQDRGGEADGFLVAVRRAER